MHGPVSLSVIVAGRLLSGAAPLLRSLGGRLGARPSVRRGEQDRRVAWIPGAVPDGEEAEAIHEAIARHHCHTYGEVVRRVGERLYRRDAAAGGWVEDIGFAYPSYLQHARRALDGLRGTMVEIGREGGE